MVGNAQPGRTHARATKWHTKFLEHLRKCGNASQASKAAGVGRSTAYEHRKTNPEFAAAWEETEQVAIDELETTLFQRARDGWLEPVYWRGEKVGEIRRFDNRLGEFFLTRLRREKYSDKALAQSVESLAQSVRDFIMAAREQDTAEGEEPEAGG